MFQKVTKMFVIKDVESVNYYEDYNSIKLIIFNLF